MTDVAYDEKTKNDEKGFLTPGNIFLLSAIITAALIVGIALSQQLQTQPTSGAAPDFAFETFDGQAMQLSDLQGNIVVLNFWASWCGPCRDEAPDLQAVYEDYQDENVIFLGIAWVDNGPASRGFLEEFGITYLNAPDIGTKIGDKYRVQGVPETFIIDRNGDIAQFFYAPINERQLVDSLDALLTEDDA